MGDSLGISSPRTFSPFLTVLCLAICLLGVGLVLWSTSLSETPSLGSSSSRDLERLASRVLAFESSANRLSYFEQTMYHLGAGEFETQEDLLNWYQELFAEIPDALNRVYLGVLLGENENLEVLKTFLEEYPVEPESASVLRETLRVAYFGGTTLMSYHELQARLAEKIPGNWFYFQLAQRLAEWRGDVSLESSLALQLDRQARPLLIKWRVGLVVELAILGFGAVGLVIFLVQAQHVRIPPALCFWTFGEGLAVLARGGALTVMILGVFALLPGGAFLLMEYGVLLLYLPMVLVAYRLLFSPGQFSLQQVFGWSPFLRQLRSNLPVALILLGLGLLGDWGIMVVGDALGYSVHWTEWFVPELVWGSRGQVLKTLTEFIILAPLFEEIIFRGLLIPTLGAKFGRHLAIMGSALLFALAHGYGLLAFLSVFWSGLLWGWAYSRTGSLLPGMAAHAVNNGLVVSFLLAFFR